MQCVNKSTREYQTLKERSGLPDFILSAEVGEYLDKLGRYPYLDELPNVDSEEAIKKDLLLNKKSATDTSNILEATHSLTIEEAVPKLNDEYRDKEIEVLEMGSRSKVYITPRPSEYSTKESEITPVNNDDVNSFLYLNQILEKLQDLYGINIIHISNADLLTKEWADIKGVSGVKAFIHNGNIYVNTDIATIDSPLHEMLHILFGSMKFQNRELYELLVSLGENFSLELAEMYPNRTREDLNEEAFITELAKYLTGLKSEIDNLDLKAKHEIFYNVTRTLDSILMGEKSVRCIPEKTLYRLDLKTLAKMVGSVSMVSDFNGTLNDAALNRILANKKQELMEKGLLKEECS